MTGEHGERFTRCVRHLVLRNRFAGGRANTPFSRVEILILTHLETGAAKTANDLRGLLLLPQSTLSRVLRKLIEEGHLLSTAGLEDKRAQLLSISPSTLELLQTTNFAVNNRMTRMYSALSESEQKAYYKGLMVIADSAGVGDGRAREDEHPSRLPMRRATVATGFLASKFMKSEFQSNEWMILTGLYEERDGTPLNADKLSVSLGLPKTTINYSLRRLESEGLVDRTPRPDDLRALDLSLSADGIAAVRRIFAASGEFFSTFLEQYSQQEVDEFLRVFWKLVKPEGAKDFSVAVESELPVAPPEVSGGLPAVEVHVADTPTLREQARGWLLETLVRERLHTKVPETLCGRDHLVLFFTLVGQGVAVAQLVKGAEPRLEMLVVHPDFKLALGELIYRTVMERVGQLLSMSEEAIHKERVLSNVQFSC